MDILNSMLITPVAGTGGVAPGLSLVQIVAVHKNGIQYDKVLLANLNNGTTRQWAFKGISNQIRFPTAFPFETGDFVHVIYKTSL